MQSGVSLVTPMVYTSTNGGLSCEQLADITVNKIIYADGGTVPPAIFQQAIEFRLRIKGVIMEALKSAKRSALVSYINDAETCGEFQTGAALRERLINGDY